MLHKEIEHLRKDAAELKAENNKLVKEIYDKKYAGERETKEEIDFKDKHIQNLEGRLEAASKTNAELKTQIAARQLDRDNLRH